MGRRSKEKENDSEEMLEGKFDASKLKSFLTKTINSKFANTVAYELGKGTAPTDVKDWISTGCTALDFICSNKKDGGIPVGKITEILGLESSGKSLICEHIAASAQKKGGFVIYIDTESALSVDFVRRIGINVEELFYAQPDTLEDVFETIEESIKKIRSVDKDVLIAVIWDSVGAVPTKKEVEGTYDPNELVGQAARVISKGLRKLTELIAKENIAVVVVSQLKTAIGLKFGDPMVATYGGKAIAYQASLRVKVSKKGYVKKLEDTIGIQCEAKVIKSKVSPPFRTCSFDTLFERGIDDCGSVLDTLKEYQKIETSGAWSIIKFNNEEIKFNGRSKWNELWKDDKFREYCLSLIEDSMVIKYDDSEEKKLSHVSIDPDSAVEVIALKDEIEESEDS